MTNIIVPRDYQHAALQALREGFRSGHKHQMLNSATGSGKSLIAAYLIQEALSKGTPSVFLVDRIALVDQFSAMLDYYGINHSIEQANHWRRRPWEKVTIASAQTLERRKNLPNMGLLLADECHVIRNQTKTFIKSMPDLPVIGLTATGFTKGLKELFSNVVNATTTDKLIEQGWLAPIRYFHAKEIDMKGARKKFDGEWADDEMERRGIAIVGDVVSEWQKKAAEHFPGEHPKTIIFSATVQHGEELCRQFQAAGVNALQISYKDGNDERRRELIEEFRRPDSSITALCSCEALSRGFDVPDIKIGVFCRPYRKSLSGWIQQLGRIMRPFPGKEYAISLDHAGNTLRFRDDQIEFFANGLLELSDGKLDSEARKDKDEKEKVEIVCKCGYVLSPSAELCPNCGHPRPKRQNKIEHRPGEMHELELNGKAKKVEPWLQDKEAVARQIWYIALERKKGDHEAAVRFAKAQYRNLFGTWSPRRIDSYAPQEPHPLLVQRIRANLIRWAHSRNNPANAKGEGR